MKLTYTKGVDNKDILVGDEQYQVMMEWEKPYMEALVDRLQPSGDVLEIGFGLGYSADAIQKYDINTHTICGGRNPYRRVRKSFSAGKQPAKHANCHHK